MDDGKIYKICGANGSGKSTFIKCIMELTRFVGKIKYQGFICYIPDSVMLPNNLTAFSFLTLLLQVKKEFNLEKLNRYILLFKLEEQIHKSISMLSFGTKRKILLISAFLTTSDIYIFDEPTNGLDQLSIKLFYNEITKLKNENKLVIIASHSQDGITTLDCENLLISEGCLNVVN